MALPKRRYTPEEYFAIERESQERHEYLDGKVRVKPGESPDHVRIVGDSLTSLNMQLRRGRSEIFTSNLRLKVDGSAYFYSDLSGISGESQVVIESGLESLVNPVLIVEVLSRSSERYNLITKFMRYQTLESFQEFVVILQNIPIIEVYTRQPDNRWAFEMAYGLNSSAVFESIGCTLLLSDVYRRVVLEPIEAID